MVIKWCYNTKKMLSYLCSSSVVAPKERHIKWQFFLGHFSTIWHGHVELAVKVTSVVFRRGGLVRRTILIPIGIRFRRRSKSNVT